MKYNISMNAVEYVVHHVPYQRLALLTNLDSSVFSHYRHGRSVIENMSIENLHALTTECKIRNFPVDMSDAVVADTRKIDEAKQLLDTVYPRMTIARTNARLTLLGYDPLPKNAIVQLQNSLRAQAFTLPHYNHLVYVTQMMKKALCIDDDKVLENFKEVLKNTGVRQYQLSLRIGDYTNYISRYLYRHKLGEGLISEWTPALWQRMADAVYPNKKNNVKLLQKQVIRGARHKADA